ncbi:Chitinase-like protein 3 [Bienertia sinuspersici]
MPHRTRPMAALLLFTGLNVVLVSSISPVYDYVCFHPYWERRANKFPCDPYDRQRERRRIERETSMRKSSMSA